MNIGLVANTLIKKNTAGVEKFTYQLYNALAKIDDKNFYTVYFKSKPSDDYWKNLTNGNNKFSYKVIKPKKGLFNSWIQIQLFKELKNNPQDVVFYPNDTITGLLNLTMSKNFKSVCVVHDLAYKVSQEYKNPLKQFLHYKTVGFVIKNANKIIVPSYFVKTKILDNYKYLKARICEQNKIEVIYEGLNDNFIDNEKITTKQIDDVKKQYNLNGKKYLYAISSIQPRKNYINMIKSFSSVVKENPNYQDIYLVITGSQLWDTDKVYKAVRDYEIQENVIFLGNTPDEHVAILLKGSMAYINVSLEEGFGLPVLEAMASKKPMIISNIPTFKELAEDNAIYVDPNSTNSIKEGMLKVLCETCFDEQIDDAYKLSQKFTWENTAKKTLQVIKNVYLNKY